MNAEDEILGRSRPTWLRTQATITGCHYEFGGVNFLSASLAGERKQFRISFSYRADGMGFSGEFMSEFAVAQGEVFFLRYNPLSPSQNTKSNGAGNGPLISLGIAASIILAILFMTVERGCN